MTNPYEITQRLYNSPHTVQSLILEDVEKRLLGGETIRDINSPFIYLLMMSGSLAAGSIQNTTSTFSSLYKRRAVGMSDLYKHFSSYDQPDVFAKGATTTISLIVDKDVVFFRSATMAENADYKKIVLPKDTVITIAGYPFTIHYPVVITINKNTRGVIVQYDLTDGTSPYQAVSNNHIDYREYRQGTFNFLDVSLPVHQMTKSTTEYDVTKTTGFNKRIRYRDKFAGVVVKHRVAGQWLTLPNEYSEMTYGNNSACVVVKVYPEQNEVVLTIPPLFFYKELIGNKINVELATTVGAISLDLTNVSENDIRVQLPTEMEDRTYTTVLEKLEILQVIPHSGVITGGRSSLSYAEIKEQLINGQTADGLLISPRQLQNHFQALGYDIATAKETFKDRIYSVSKPIQHPDGTYIPGGMFTLMIPFYLDYGVYGNHFSKTNRSVVLYPSMHYYYDDDKDIVRILTPAELEHLQDLFVGDKQAFCNVINTKNYVRSPYHIEVRMNDGLFYTNFFNLNDTAIKDIEYKDENQQTPERVVVTGASCYHNCLKSEQVDGYKYSVAIEVELSDGIIKSIGKQINSIGLEEALKAVKCYGFVTIKGYQLYQQGVYVAGSYNPTKKTIQFLLQYRPMYLFNNTTSMIIDLADNPNESSWYFPGMDYVDVGLTHKMNVLFTIDTAVLNDLTVSPATLFGTFLTVAGHQLNHYSLTVKLGECITRRLHNSVDVVYNTGYYDLDELNASRPRYTEDVYAYHKDDVPKRDEDGVIVLSYNGHEVIKTPTITQLGPPTVTTGLSTDNMTFVNGQPIFVGVALDARRGDLVLIDDEPVVLHKAGDVMYGEDITEEQLNKLLAIDAVFMGSNIFYADNSAVYTYILAILNQINGYYLDLVDSQARLIENTTVKYKPSKTIGRALYYNQYEDFFQYDLELTMKFRLHVSANVKNDTKLQRIIRREAIALIEQQFNSGSISMPIIAENLRWKFNDTVHYIDILGINGDISRQTLLVADKTTKPSLKQELYLNNEGVLGIRKALELIFVG